MDCPAIGGVMAGGIAAAVAAWAWHHYTTPVRWQRHKYQKAKAAAEAKAKAAASTVAAHAHEALRKNPRPPWGQAQGAGVQPGYNEREGMRTRAS